MISIIKYNLLDEVYLHYVCKKLKQSLREMHTGLTWSIKRIEEREWGSLAIQSCMRLVLFGSYYSTKFCAAKMIQKRINSMINKLIKHSLLHVNKDDLTNEFYYFRQKSHNG